MDSLNFCREYKAIHTGKMFGISRSFIILRLNYSTRVSSSSICVFWHICASKQEERWSSRIDVTFDGLIHFSSLSTNMWDCARHWALMKTNLTFEKQLGYKPYSFLLAAMSPTRTKQTWSMHTYLTVVSAARCRTAGWKSHLAPFQPDEKNVLSLVHISTFLCFFRRIRRSG